MTSSLSISKTKKESNSLEDKNAIFLRLRANFMNAQQEFQSQNYEQCMELLNQVIKSLNGQDKEEDVFNTKECDGNSRSEVESDDAEHKNHILTQLQTLCYSLRGSCHFELKEYEEAENDYTKSLNNRESALDYEGRGHSRFELQKFESSLEDFIKSSKIVEDPFIFKQIGDTYNEIQAYQNAHQFYEKSLLLDPGNCTVYNNMAANFLDQQMYNECITYCSKCILLDNRHDMAYVTRGNAQRELRNFKEAINDFDNALKLEIDEPYALFNRAYTYYLMGNPTKGLQDCNRSLQVLLMELEKSPSCREFVEERVSLKSILSPPMTSSPSTRRSYPLITDEQHKNIAHQANAQGYNKQESMKMRKKNQIISRQDISKVIGPIAYALMRRGQILCHFKHYREAINDLKAAKLLDSLDKCYIYYKVKLMDEIERIKLLMEQEKIQELKMKKKLLDCYVICEY